MSADPYRMVRAELTAETSRSLIAALNAELSEAYPEAGANHFGLDTSEVATGRGVFLLAMDGDLAVGCGALRLLEDGSGELKRMYVVPALRGRGLGRRLVAALEEEARSFGARRLVLETGVRQETALALYRAMGFRTIPLFGEYCLSPDTSICLGKELEPARA